MTSELKVRTTPATSVETGPVGALTVETLMVEVEVPAAGRLRPDHVRSHSTHCYWDFVDCRWRCSRE